MVVGFIKRTRQYIGNSGGSTVEPADRPKWPEDNKASLMKVHDISSADWKEPEDVLRIVIDEDDPDNAERVAKLRERYIPELKSTFSEEETEQEWTEETKDEQDVEFELAEDGSVKKEASGAYIQKMVTKTVVVSRERQTFNKNLAALKAVSSWPKSQKLQEREAALDELAANEARKEVLRGKESLTDEEKDEAIKLALK